MKQKKSFLWVCALLIGVMITTAFAPAFASTTIALTAEQDDTQVLDDASEQTLNIDINANYYSTQTDGEYKIIFTTLSEIPAFQKLDFKISLTNAKVDRASFESGILTGREAEVLRGDSSATYTLTAESAEAIAAKNAIAALEIFEAQVPTAENLVFSEFYLIDAEEKTWTVTPNITFQAGPIIPVLSEKEQAVYDMVIALEKASTVSYYNEDGSLAPIADMLIPVNTAKASYEALTDEEKAHVTTVLEYYNYSIESMETLSTVLNTMDKAKGLIEIAYAFKTVSADDILEYQFMLAVYQDKKAEIDTSVLSANPVATLELETADTAIASMKETLDTKLASSDFEDKSYACGDQIDVIQSFNNHVYYKDYLTALNTQIEAVKKDIEDNFDGRAESKENLLNHLSSYAGKIELIQNGIDDFPVMTCEEIMRGNPFKVKFSRKTLLDDSIDVSVRIVITNKEGRKLDEQEATFPHNTTTLSVPFTSSKVKYPKDEKVTITAYYILDETSFFLDSQEVECLNTRNNSPGIGNVNSPVNGLLGSTSSSVNNKKDEEEPSGSTTGGTIFPSEETIEPENNTSSAVVFTDIASYGWAKEAIEGLYYAGIVNGMEDGIYNPAGIVTREQFAKMVVQLFNVTTGHTQTNFVDVKTDAWYAPYITAAMQAGYIQGQSNEYFGIGESIMRQDMATILYRALGDQNSKAVLSFTDIDNIAPYAEDAIAELVGLGILNGYEDGTFLPRGTATRAEAAKAIWGIYQILN